MIGGQRLIGDRHVLVADGFDRVARADERDHRIAAIARQAIGQHRLVLDGGVDAIEVGRHVARRQQPARGPAAPRRSASRSPTVKRAEACGERIDAQHRAHPPGSHRRRSARCRSAWRGHRPWRCWRRRCRRAPPPPALRTSQHRFDDLLIAGAAAQHAAQRILDLGARRIGAARQQVARRHQHAGRADAALRGAVGEERTLQIVELARRAQPFDRGDRARRRIGRPAPGRRRPVRRRAAPCRRRNRRRCSRSWCR